MTGTDVLVIGAGVIGLSTGVLLAERLGARVEIVAAELPQATTSAAATGMCGPVFRGPDERAVRWELATVAHLSELADAEPAAGVRWATGLAAAPAGMGSAPPLADESALVRLADPDELPAGFAFGMWVRIPLVDLPVYLRYLADRFAAAGGRLRQGRVDALAGAAERAPVLVNCTGVGAAALCADRELRPVRGQQVVVANPGLEGFFMPAPGASEWASWHAHGDHVLLGGVALEDDRDTRPAPQIAAGIIERCSRLEPRLAGATVIGHRAGLRPARPRARLEVEVIGSSPCVHQYGHGSVGVLQSWGSALEAVELVGGRSPAAS
jgi:D-amino-acid oxidase